MSIDTTEPTKKPLEYDRRIYLLRQWESELYHVMDKQKKDPQTIQSMMFTTSTDSIRDLMEYAIKGIKSELLEGVE